MSNPGAFPPSPGEFNAPIGIDVKGDKVWISEGTGTPVTVRVCTWYARQLTDCGDPYNLGDSTLTRAGQVALYPNTNPSKAYVAATDDNSLVDCDVNGNAGIDVDAMLVECEALNITENADGVIPVKPIGVDVAADGTVWIGHDGGVTWCQEVPPLALNETCGTIDMDVDGMNGVWVEGSTLYVANTAGKTITTCQIIAGPGLQNCLPNVEPYGKWNDGPGYAGLDVWKGRVYAPLQTGGAKISVCTPLPPAGLSPTIASCVDRFWPVGGFTPAGSVNIAHAPPPTIP